MKSIKFVLSISLFFGVTTKVSSFSNDDRTINISNKPEDCIFVTSQSGYFSYSSTSNSEIVCAIYLMAASHKRIQVTFTEFDVPCKTKDGLPNLIQYVDGWELNGEVFPSNLNENYSAEQNEFCADNTPLNRTFVSSQNGAQIMYKIPQVGGRFTIFVEHKEHPKPCNIIHIDEPYYILENKGSEVNCSIWTPYPTVFKFNSYSVGKPISSENSDHECPQFGDRIEIGGGGMDSNQIQVLRTICDVSKDKGDPEESINCSSTTIKLVSTGNYRNYLNISLNSISSDEEARRKAKYQCQIS